MTRRSVVAQPPAEALVGKAAEVLFSYLMKDKRFTDEMLGHYRHLFEKKQKHIYDPKTAVRAFDLVTNHAAKRYATEVDESGNPYHVLFPKAATDIVSKKLLDLFEQRYQAGKIPELLGIKKGAMSTLPETISVNGHIYMRYAYEWGIVRDFVIDMQNSGWDYLGRDGDRFMLTMSPENPERLQHHMSGARRILNRHDFISIGENIFENEKEELVVELRPHGESISILVRPQRPEEEEQEPPEPGNLPTEVPTAPAEVSHAAAVEYAGNIYVAIDQEK